ncbi:hypothetical protein JCM3774_004597 [Rhodotorula dairenensis]
MHAGDCERELAVVVHEALRRLASESTTATVAHSALETALSTTDSLPRGTDSARARRTLWALQDRVSTYEALYVAADADHDAPRIRHGRTFSTVATRQPPPAADDDDDDDDDDEPASELLQLPPPPSLAAFLATPLVLTALSLAALAALPELSLLCSLHPTELSPHRARILDAVPLWADPQAYAELLPALPESEHDDDDDADAQEPRERQGWPDEAQPWRPEPDWSEQAPYAPTTTTAAAVRRSAAEVRAWYLARVAAHVDAGFVDEALSLIQHGAARNVSGLEQTGEDVSLLAKLVHERPPAPDDDEEEDEEDPWTLARWRSLKPVEVIHAYTAHGTPANLPHTIRSLVMPYLHVLQARTERRPSSSLSDRDPAASSASSSSTTPSEYLYEYLLSLPPRSHVPSDRDGASGLDLFLAVVEASIPTLPASQRLVPSDSDLARLAIAALYGAGRAGATAHAAVVMGRVFECLPAFDDFHTTADDVDDTDAVDLFSLGAAARTAPIDIFRALKPASPKALSAHLDTLDLHLSQLETFLRYSSPPVSSGSGGDGLAWFLSSYRDREAQAQWATRLARTAFTGGGGRSGDPAEFESEDEWVGLMEFMADATGVATATATAQQQQPNTLSPPLDRDDAIRKGLGRAFCLLERQEVLRIFFGGLLAAGRFSLARSLFDPTPSSSASTAAAAATTTSTLAPLPPTVVEELVISASREFYDNAESGNLHTDEMKLALECLAAAPQQTASLRRERDFIEATSKLCSYRLDSRPGIALTPIELRHAPDRLVFISRLLSANPQVARHPDMVLELARKLVAEQWTGGASEVRVLTMLSETATAAGDWTLAAEMCGRIVQAVEALRKRSARTTAAADANQLKEEEKAVEAAADQAWRACFQLGKHAGWTSDPRKKLDVLGQALTLCPPERIQDILPAWNKLELQVAQEALLSEQEAKSAAGGRAKTAAAAAAAATGPGAAHAAETAARAAAEATAAGAARVAGFLAAAAARGSTHATAATTAVASNSAATARTPTSPRAFTALHQASRLASPTSAAQAGASASHLAHETAAAASHTLRRAAAFFGGGGGGGGRAVGRADSSVSPSRGSVRSNTPGTPPRSPARGGPATAGQMGSAPSPPPSLSSRTAGSRFSAALGSLTDSEPSASRTPTLPASPPPSRGGANLGFTARQAGAANSGGGGVSGFGLRAGLSNTLTAGVGWLIGADEMLEDERRRRAEEEEQARERARRAAAAAEPDRAARSQAGQLAARAASPSQAAPSVRPGSRAKLGAKPVGRTKLQATKLGGNTPPATRVTQAPPPPPPTQQETAETDEWDACGPVAVTLALGPADDEESDLMDVDVRPAQADVLAAVQSVRRHDGPVRMDLDFPERSDSSAPACAFSVAVVDTNVLISHLALLRAFVRLADEIPTSNRPLLFVPQIVLSELDGLKASQRPADFCDHDDRPPSRANISVLARSAIGWLLHTISSGSTVLRGQKRTETLLPLTNGARLAEDNDTLVLDAALWCRDHGVAQNVFLLTDDRNLQLRATVEGLHAHGVATHRGAADLVALLSLASSEVASAAAASESQKVSRRVSRYAAPPARSDKPPSPRPRQHGDPSALSWQTRSVGSDAQRLPLPAHSNAATDPGGSWSAGADQQPMYAETGDYMTDEHPDEMTLGPPLYADLPPPPLVSVENATDVFYNIAVLVSHFIALPIYRHAYQHLERTNALQRKEWLAELGDWRRWQPEACVARARKYWEDGDIQGLCQTGLEYAYSAPVAPKLQAPPPATIPVVAPSLTKSQSKWSTPTSSSASNGVQPTLSPRSIPALSSPRGRQAPQLAHVYRDLPVVRDFLGATPDSIPSWSVPRWEVVIETTGLFLVAILGGTFKTDVRREVDEIVQAWVADLRTCGISVDVQI